jgi:hypothetical protein
MGSDYAGLPIQRGVDRPSMPNSLTKRPDSLSQLVQGSCEPCQTFHWWMSPTVGSVEFFPPQGDPR